MSGYPFGAIPDPDRNGNGGSQDVSFLRVAIAAQDGADRPCGTPRDPIMNLASKQAPFREAHALKMA